MEQSPHELQSSFCRCFSSLSAKPVSLLVVLFLIKPSIASTSVLSEMVKGRTLDAAFHISPKEVGADSMMALEILAAMEKKYKVIIPEERLKEMTTVNKIIEMVETAKKRKKNR